MKVTIEQPDILVLRYQQEKTDEDYGSCMWARFYLDLKNYTMSIESDCGNYVHGWAPTPDHESFLKLLSRMDGDYLLYKISNQTVIDGDVTAKNVVAMVKDIAEGELEEVDAFTLEEIKDACYHHHDERDLVTAVLDAALASAVYKELERNTYELYGCVVKDYPTNAKKIVSVFVSCIRPKIKEIIDGTVTMLSIVGKNEED